MESRVFINPNAPIAVSRYGEAVSECRSRAESLKISPSRVERSPFQNMDLFTPLSGLQSASSIFPDGLPGLHSTRSITALRADTSHCSPILQPYEFDEPRSSPVDHKPSRNSAGTWSGIIPKTSDTKAARSKIPTPSKTGVKQRLSIPNFASPTLASTMRDRRDVARPHLRTDDFDTSRDNLAQAPNRKPTYSTATVVKRPHAPLLLTQLRAARQNGTSQRSSGLEVRDDKHPKKCVVVSNKEYGADVLMQATTRQGNKSAQVYVRRSLPPLPTSATSKQSATKSFIKPDVSCTDFDQVKTSIRLVAPSQEEEVHKNMPSQCIHASNVVDTVSEPKGVSSDNFHGASDTDTWKTQAQILKEMHIWGPGLSRHASLQSSKSLTAVLTNASRNQSVEDEELPPDLPQSSKPGSVADHTGTWNFDECNKENRVESETSADSTSIMIVTEDSSNMTSGIERKNASCQQGSDVEPVVKHIANQLLNAVRRRDKAIPIVQPDPDAPLSTPIQRTKLLGLQSTQLRPEAERFHPSLSRRLSVNAEPFIPGRKSVSNSAQLFEILEDNNQIESPVALPWDPRTARLRYVENQPTLYTSEEPVFFNDTTAPALKQNAWATSDSLNENVLLDTNENGWKADHRTGFEIPERTYALNMHARFVRNRDAMETAQKLLEGDWYIDDSQQWWEPPVPMGFGARAAFRQPRRSEPLGEGVLKESAAMGHPMCSTRHEEDSWRCVRRPLRSPRHLRKPLGPRYL